MSQQEVLGTVRHIVGAIGSVFATRGIINANEVELIGGVVSAVAALAWSIYEKRRR